MLIVLAKSPFGIMLFSRMPNCDEEEISFLHNFDLFFLCARVIQEFTDFHKISEFLYVSYPLCMPKKHTGTH